MENLSPVMEAPEDVEVGGGKWDVRGTYEEITFLEEEKQPTADYRVPARLAKPVDLRRRHAHNNFCLS